MVLDELVIGVSADSEPRDEIAAIEAFPTSALDDGAVIDERTWDAVSIGKEFPWLWIGIGSAAVIAIVAVAAVAKRRKK